MYSLPLSCVAGQRRLLLYQILAKLLCAMATRGIRQLQILSLLNLRDCSKALVSQIPDLLALGVRFH